MKNDVKIIVNSHEVKRELFTEWQIQHLFEATIYL